LYYDESLDFDEFNFKDYQKLQKLEREDRRKAIESMIDEDLKKRSFVREKGIEGEILKFRIGG
jgi:hypothetical protein